jgi:hypothetical protein
VVVRRKECAEQLAPLSTRGTRSAQQALDLGMRELAPPSVVVATAAAGEHRASGSMVATDHPGAAASRCSRSRSTATLVDGGWKQSPIGATISRSLDHNLGIEMPPKHTLTVSAVPAKPRPNSAERRAAEIAATANQQAELKREAAERRAARAAKPEPKDERLTRPATWKSA